MTYRSHTSLFTLIIAAIITIMASSSAYAQKEDKVKPKAVPNTIEQTKPYVKSSKGQWKVTCRKKTLKSPEGKTLKEREQCVVAQNATSTKNKELSSRVLFIQAARKDKDGKVIPFETMEISVPMGVYLPVGVAVEVDGKPLNRFDYIQCIARICVAHAAFEDKQLNKVLSSKEMKIHIAFPPNISHVMKIDMKNAKAAIAARDKVHASYK